MAQHLHSQVVYGLPCGVTFALGTGCVRMGRDGHVQGARGAPGHVTAPARQVSTSCPHGGAQGLPSLPVTGSSTSSVKGWYISWAKGVVRVVAKHGAAEGTSWGLRRCQGLGEWHG